MTNQSLTIPIIDDNILEHDEQFQLSIFPNSLPDRVIRTDPNIASVTIKDNDGKFM